MVFTVYVELVNVEQHAIALTNLYDWMSNKKYRQYSEAYEKVMSLLIKLAVDQRKGRMIRESFHNFKNVVLNASIESIEVISLLISDC